MKIKMYKTIIMPVVLYGCETWSLILAGNQAEGIWEQDHEANICAQAGWAWGLEKTLQRGTS